MNRFKERSTLIKRGQHLTSWTFLKKSLQVLKYVFSYDFTATRQCLNRFTAISRWHIPLTCQHQDDQNLWTKSIFALSHGCSIRWDSRSNKMLRRPKWSPSSSIAFVGRWLKIFKVVFKPRSWTCFSARYLCCEKIHMLSFLRNH